MAIASRIPLFIALLSSPSTLFAQSLSTTSLFVPVEYVSKSFSASIAGSDATATTYIFSPGCDDRACGPITLIQGPGTALFNETDQPITTIYDCALFPSSGTPTSASCTLSSTSPGYAFPSPVTAHFPADSGYAFPLYEVVITATPSDIWGWATGTSHRASLFNPLTEEPIGTTTMAATGTGMGSVAVTSASSSSGTGIFEGPAVTATPSSSMPTGQAASASSPTSSASAALTSSTSGGKRSMNSSVLLSISGMVSGLVSLLILQ